MFARPWRGRSLELRVERATYDMHLDDDDPIGDGVESTPVNQQV
jgi:hypothetical protein